jgi:hypothetical protein
VNTAPLHRPLVNCVGQHSRMYLCLVSFFGCRIAPNPPPSLAGERGNRVPGGVRHSVSKLRTGYNESRYRNNTIGGSRTGWWRAAGRVRVTKFAIPTPAYHYAVEHDERL